MTPRSCPWVVNALSERVLAHPLAGYNLVTLRERADGKIAVIAPFFITIDTTWPPARGPECSVCGRVPHHPWPGAMESIRWV